jgi:hypothetical protein
MGMSLIEETELKLVQRKGLAAAILGVMAHAVAIRTSVYGEAVRPVFEAVTKDMQDLEKELAEYRTTVERQAS